MTKAYAPFPGDVKKAERTWTLYSCDNTYCEAYRSRWPVRGTEDGTARRCPTCSKIGEFVTGSRCKT
jgi:hypothetical protein